MKNCICGNTLPYEKCCGRLIEEGECAQTALELMRSRYSAYVLQNGKYIYDTCSSNLQNIDDIEAINTQKIEWIGLKVVSSSELEVTFMAYYKVDEKIEVMKEHSFFIQENGLFKYDRGIQLEADIARNEPCPCGSGKKYKRCCA